LSKIIKNCKKFTLFNKTRFPSPLYNAIVDRENHIIKNNSQIISFPQAFEFYIKHFLYKPDNQVT